MTSAVKTECPNARSDHFDTEEAARAEVFERKIRESCRGRAGGTVRHVEPCEPCGMWMIVSPTQRDHRRSRRR